MDEVRDLFVSLNPARKHTARSTNGLSGFVINTIGRLK